MYFKIQDNLIYKHTPEDKDKQTILKQTYRQTINFSLFFSDSEFLPSDTNEAH